MNRHTFTSASLIAAGALLILQPLASLAQQKKVFTPAELAQQQRDTAARLAAAAKKKAQRAAAAAGQPAPAGAPGAGQVVSISVTNNTQVAFRAVINGTDGSPQVVGEIPPSAQSGGPTQLQSYAGQAWGFANPDGQIVMSYTATAAPQQRYSIGSPNPQTQQPPTGGQNGGKVVRLTVQNRWGSTVYATRAKARGDVFNIEPSGGTLTSVAGTQWVFLNENGQEIYAYTAGDSPKQTVVIPTPAERQGSIDRKWETDTKEKNATAAKQQRQQDFLRRINEARQQAGLAPVKWSQKAADKARQTYNPLGGGYSFAMAYSTGGPQSPVGVLEYWMENSWEKVAIFFNPACTAVGYAEVAGQGVGFEYEPR